MRSDRSAVRLTGSTWRSGPNTGLCYARIATCFLFASDSSAGVRQHHGGVPCNGATAVEVDSVVLNIYTSAERTRVDSQHGAPSAEKPSEGTHMTRVTSHPAVVPSDPEVPPASGEEAQFGTVAEAAFFRCERIWKPRTAAVNRAYLRNQILPWFHDRPVADITNREVRRWFASLRATPAAADRSLPILSTIMRHAEVHGHRPEDSNPCTGLRRYRRRGRERFLTAGEVRRLGAALVAREAASPFPAAVVRLLLLTGCRQSEIRTLRWQDYRDGHLFLPDSKTGPRTVWLSSPARSVLDRLPRMGRWSFPAPKGAGPMATETLYSFWRPLRAEAGLPDVRLHDLRHSYASFALHQGETVRTIGRLLGHRDPATTLKYTHFADTMVREAAEAVGTALGRGG